MGEVVGVLGLGEAGLRYAMDLLAEGVTVAGYDPAGLGARACPAGLRLAGGAADAASGAGVVLSLTTAGAAEQAARDAVPGLRDGAVYADLNTATPALKQRVAAVLAGTGALFADVAVLAPVPRAGLQSPVAVSGPGRDKLSSFLTRFAVPVEDAGPDPGAAAGRKLIRSVFMKGLAAVIGETMDIAAREGLAGWAREQVTAELTAADAALVARLIDGTRQHAGRRVAEMRAAHDYAAGLGAGDPVVRAVIARLEAIAGGPERPAARR